jgi:photosystem II stability/assembly factor-like uncharacterized protein
MLSQLFVRIPCTVLVLCIFLCPIEALAIEPSFDKVFFADSMHGYALGLSNSAHVVLKSSDGGASWKIVYESENIVRRYGSYSYQTTTILNGLYFRTIDQGWVIGGDGTLIATDDGGLSWKRVESGTTEDLMAISSGPAGNLLVVGKQGTLLISDVQNETWVHCPVPTSANLTAVAVLPSGLVLVLGRDRLFSSTQLCGNWTTHGPYSETDLFGMAFADEMTGYLRSNLLFVTNDGGAGISWVRLPADPQHQLYVRKVYVTTAGTVFVVRGYADTGSTVNIIGDPLPSNSTVFRKKSGRELFEPILQIQDSQTGSAFLEDIFFLDDQHGWAVGDGGTVFITTNGGDDWQRIRVDLEP